MSEMPTFPDQLHIDHIRRRLWIGREFGQAAVMVGAGFSRNADRLSTTTSQFPSWEDLAVIMFNELYPSGSLTEANRKQEQRTRTAGAGALRLASEYQEVFGRIALNDLLLRSIPDDHYSPGRLHELLLSLPWADVFTTNYDTLLERSQPLVYDKKYDVVGSVSCIPGRMKPRIVKLHGSFPSDPPPFIITEEDYRTYPRKFAPLVNMVQEALMENVLCLIGFSGDDPNFLYWSGWVRDNLGPNAPPIYLCGLLELTYAQRLVLKKKNIVAVDLTPLFPKANWPDPRVRHARALEWFLLNLLYGAPPTVIHWPIPLSGIRHKPSEGLPPLPKPRQLSAPGEIRPSHSPLEKDDLKALYSTWRQTRTEYPGWVIAPRGNRESLWTYTRYWIGPILDSIHKLPPPHNLLLLFELNWRLETALVPLINETDWPKSAAWIVEAFNPYPSLVHSNEASIRPDTHPYGEQVGEETWTSIAHAWVELIFALVRKAREGRDEEQFSLWMSRLEKMIEQHNEWRMRWFYEECLFQMSRFDQDSLRSALERWPAIYDVPFWQVKRASILAEIGELKDAELLAERALSEIRPRLRPYSIEYSLLSQEGCAMLLLQLIKGRGDVAEQYLDRREKLNTYRCNPRPEIETFRSILDRPRPIPKPETQIKKDFDIGRVIRTEHPSIALSISESMPAFAFLRLLEEGAMPVRCGTIDLSINELVNSAKWIAPIAPLLAAKCMIRAREDRQIKEWFDRVRVATLTQEDADYLGQLLMPSLRQSIEYLDRNAGGISSRGMDYLESHIKSLSEVISRLCLRFGDEQLADLFMLTADIYKRPVFRERDFLHKSINVLFRRLLYALPQSKILAQVSDLLSLPIPSDSGFEVSTSEWCPEPMTHIKWLENTKLDPTFDRSSWSAPIANLTRAVKDGSKEARERAIARLTKIHEIDGLTDEENAAFALALWSRIDPQKRLPSDTNLPECSFLRLPEPTAGAAKTNLRQYLLSTDLPRFGKQSRFDFRHSGPDRHLEQLIGATVPLFLDDGESKQRYINWTPDEAISLLKKVAAWWDDEKENLQSGHRDFADNLKDYFLPLLMDLMGEIIFPRLANVDQGQKDVALRLLLEMEQCGLCVRRALPMTLFFHADSCSDVAHELRAKSNSAELLEIQDYIAGLFCWVIYGARQLMEAPPSDLLEEWVNRIRTCRQPGLATSIGQMIVLVERLPDVLSESQIGSLCIALEYLLWQTELPSGRDRDRLDGCSTIIPVEDRPEYREQAATLAYQLFVYFTERSKEIPQILRTWRDVCKSDILPEVKRAWLELG